MPSRRRPRQAADAAGCSRRATAGRTRRGSSRCPGRQQHDARPGRNAAASGRGRCAALRHRPADIAPRRPTPARAARNAKLGRNSRTPSWGGVPGRARTTSSTAQLATTSMPAGCDRHRRSTDASPDRRQHQQADRHGHGRPEERVVPGQRVVEVVHPAQEPGRDVDPRLVRPVQVQVQERRRCRRSGSCHSGGFRARRTSPAPPAARRPGPWPPRGRGKPRPRPQRAGGRSSRWPWC